MGQSIHLVLNDHAICGLIVQNNVIIFFHPGSPSFFDERLVRPVFQEASSVISHSKGSQQINNEAITNPINRKSCKSLSDAGSVKSYVKKKE